MIIEEFEVPAYLSHCLAAEAANLLLSSGAIVVDGHACID
jgi:hypothetical protein